MTIRTTIKTTSRQVKFEIPAEMVGKELEITATEKEARNPPLGRQYQMAAAENKELATEFQTVDLEGWVHDY